MSIVVDIIGSNESSNGNGIMSYDWSHLDSIVILIYVFRYDTVNDAFKKKLHWNLDFKMKIVMMQKNTLYTKKTSISTKASI